MRHVAPLLLALLLTVVAQAQLKGRVLNSNGEPAEFATVALFKDSVTAGSPRSYAITDEKGNFRLPLSAKKGEWLVVRYLGHKEYRKPVDEPRAFQDIQLVADATRLDEITVESTYTGVAVRGDTIQFDTEHFRTGAEETVAEVLRNIPGMEVKDNGSVSYGGRDVDKVLVNGKDMFASGSDGVINNLNAEAVNSAELLTNYKSDNFVDDFKSQDLMALNLKTKKKRTVNGKAELAGGLIGKVRGAGSLLYVNDNFSLSTIMGGNNIGEAAFSIADYITSHVGLDNLISSGASALTLSSEEMSMLMPSSNTYRSDNGIASFNASYQKSKKFKIKGTALFSGSGIEAGSFSEQNYLTLDMFNRNTSQNQKQNYYASANLQETYRPTDKVELSNLTSVNHSRMHSLDSLAESGFTNTFAEEDNRLTKTFVKEELAMNVKTESGLLSAHVLLDNTSRNFSYGLLTDQALLPVGYDTLADGSLTLDTRRDIGLLNLQPDISYAWRMGDGFILTSSLQFAHNANTFKYTDNETPIDEQLTWNTGTGSLKFSRRNGLFRFSLGADLRRTAWHSTLSGLTDDAKWHLLPSATLRLVFSSSHELSLSAQRNYAPIEMEYLLRSPMVSSYSSLYAGSVITSPFAESSNASLHYNIYDMYSNTTLYCSASYSDGRFSTRSHIVQDSTIATQTYYDNDGRMQTMYANAYLNKGIGLLPLDAKVSFSVSNSVSENDVNNIDSRLTSWNYGGSMGLRSRAKQIVNGEVNLNYSASASHRTGSETTNGLQQMGADAAVLLASTHWSGRLGFGFSHLDNVVYQRNYYDLTFRIEYKLNRLRFVVRGSNVLNLNGDEWVSITSTALYEGTTRYRRMPGYLLAGVAWRF
ncbi:MAG: hypothetical protein IJ684_05500 [Bacteroidales bacterium]|nr:hypothetical protein [Bacteroidales bacterium]